MTRAQIANDRAADWIIRRQSGCWSDADQADFDGWLAEADGNKAAYWRLKHSWREADRIGALGPSFTWVEDGLGDQPAPAVAWKHIGIAASLILMIGAVFGIFLLNPPQHR